MERMLSTTTIELVESTLAAVERAEQAVEDLIDHERERERRERIDPLKGELARIKGAHREIERLFT